MAAKTGMPVRKVPTLVKPIRAKATATPVRGIKPNALKKGIIRKKGYADIG